jgi:hypothetical protein
MSQLTNEQIGVTVRDTNAVLGALCEAQIEAMRNHIFGNVPMVSWKDGKVVEISPSELLKRLEILGVPLYGPLT